MLSYRPYLAPVVAVVALAGCQHVSRQPLDVPAHVEEWRTRDIRIAPIAALTGVLAAGGTEVVPSQFDPEDGLSLVEAEAIALWYNPGLRVARAEAAVALARAATAGLFPPPTIEIEGGRMRADSDPGGGMLDRDTREFLSGASHISRSWIASGGLSFTLPISGRLSAERAWRGAGADAAALGTAAAEWALLGDFHEAWIDWSAQIHRAALLEAHLKVVEEFTEGAVRLAGAGELEPGSGRLFEIERGLTRAQLDEAVHREREGRLRLLAMAGLSPGVPVQLLPSVRIHETPDREALPACTVAVDHPRIAELKAAYESAERRLRLELRKQYPDIAIGPRFSDQDDETSITLGLGAPVPVWNLNRAGIAEAVAERDAARVRVYAAYEELAGELAQREAGLGGARAKRMRIENEVAPLVDTQIAEAQALLHVGEADLALLYNVLTQALDIKMQLVDAVADEQIALARIHSLATPHRTTISPGEEADDDSNQ